MIPDFSKNTIDTLAKRAAYKCSNPDCRVNTTGPNSSPKKFTTIGEAAHIYGARIGSKRYNSNMADVARAEITNSIWLCRNCHKLIDTDDLKYSATTLFIWREKHEEYIASILGNTTDIIIYEEQVSYLKEFDNYPPIIKRIILDKPNGWEYRLTAEFMRFFNDPIFRKLNDLKAGVYLKNLENIESDKAVNWIQNRLSELSRIVPPAVGLLDLLTKSWGKLGEPGDVKEIHHVTKLIKDYLEHVVSFEERIHFVNFPQEYQRLVDLLNDVIGSQVEKFSNIPNDLEEIITLSENLLYNENHEAIKNHEIIKKEIVFELPDNWENEFNKEFIKLKSKQANPLTNSSGCLSGVIILLIITILILNT